MDYFDFLMKHSDSIITVVGLILGYFGVDVMSRRTTFRKERWLEASKLAFKAVELAETEGWSGADKAKKAVQLATQYMESFELTPNSKETSRWLDVFSALASKEKVGKGSVTGSGN